MMVPRGGGYKFERHKLLRYSQTDPLQWNGKRLKVHSIPSSKLCDSKAASSVDVMMPRSEKRCHNGERITVHCERLGCILGGAVSL